MRTLLRKATFISFIAGICIGAIGTGVRADLRGSGVFPDVQQESYYDDAIGQMYAEHIITGYSNGRFGPDDPVTRGQIAVIMQRFLERVEGVDTDDSSSSSRRSRSSSSSAQSSSSSEEEDDGVLNPNGAFRFTVNAADISEGSANVSITVVRTEGDNDDASVQYETSNGTAESGEDYTATASRLDFANGVSSKTLTVAITNDSDAEGSETFTISLKNPTGGAELASSNTSVTVRIIDNETGGASSSATGGPAPVQGALGFGATAYAIAESAETLTVFVDRRGGSQGQVTVQYATTEGSANDGEDYTQTSGTLTFGNGETAKSFTVAITDNTTKRGNKTFTMTLSAPTGGAILDTTASVVATIMDDETVATGTGTLQLHEGSYDVIEGDPVSVTIERLGGTDNEVAVKYETVNGTAKAGFDFTALSGTLTFREGERQKVVTIATDDDALSDEYNEQFTFRIFEPNSGTELGTPTSASITING